MSIGSSCVIELYLNSVWTDISAYVRADPGVEISFGVRGEAGTADPATASMVVNNFDGRFTPKNATGAWYGLIKRGVPLRITQSSVVRFIGEVNEFPTRWDPSGGDIWVPLLASGPLRRLLHSSTLNSPARTFLSRKGVADGGTITGYWPMEDEDGSSVFASGLADGTPMTYTGSPGFADASGSAGSGPIATMAGVSTVGTASTVGGTEFTVGFLLNMPVGGTANGAILCQFSTYGTAHSWVLTYETGGLIRLRVYASPGGVYTEVENAVTNLVLDGNTRYITLEATNNGANIDYSLSATGVGSYLDSVVGYSCTSPAKVYLGYASLITGSVGMGHLITSNDNQTLSTFSWNSALLGYAGESVEDRMARIGTLAGVSMTVSDSSQDTTLLGPQPFGSPLEVMRDAEAADAGGILRDSLSTLNALNYITRTFRYNDATPDLVLNYASGHLSPPLNPVDDDALLANDVTVTRTDGSSARAVDTTGPLNSLPWPTGIGLYEQSVTLNVYADSVLPALAGWLLTLGTIDETRFPVLTIDLGKNPSLVASFDGLRPGYQVTIAGLPAWAGGAGTVVLHCLGWVERITDHLRVVELNCTPGSPYDSVRLNDSVFARLDSSTTTANEAIDTTETGIDYTGGSWITTASHPAEFPFDILIGGEQMTVTSATGTTFTVTRSVNGVVKSHLIGTPVHVARPMRLAL